MHIEIKMFEFARVETCLNDETCWAYELYDTDKFYQL